MMTDATQVTGSQLTASPRAGDVLAERYELLEAVDFEGPSIGFRGLDQETERPVLVRVLSAPGLAPKSCDQVVAKLRPLIGLGGRFLSPLLDADCERRLPFTVEPFPPGTQLSAILEARRRRGQPLGPQEALPVIARLAAALAALPKGWHHGDVRAERVWLDADGLRLTGGYLLAALLPRDRASHIAALGPRTMTYPPEAAHGRTSEASDRWGVAAIAWEALTGRAPDALTSANELPPALTAALTALLSSDPEARPRDLSAVLTALAAHANMAVPQLDPEPHSPPPSIRPHARRKIEEADPDGTQEISFEEIIEESGESGGTDAGATGATKAAGGTSRGAESLSKTARQRVADSLDPRLVRAALASHRSALADGGSTSGPSDHGTKEPRAPTRRADDVLNPRSVPAPRSIRTDQSDEIEELPSDDLELLDSGPSLPAAPPSSIALPALEQSGTTASSHPVPPLGIPLATRAPQAQPPRPPRSVFVSALPPISEPLGLPELDPSRLPLDPSLERGAALSAADITTSPQTPVRLESRERTFLTRNGWRSKSGAIIVIGAVLLALLIIGAGFLIAAHRRSEAAQRRQIEERLQELRRGSVRPPTGRPTPDG